MRRQRLQGVDHDAPKQTVSGNTAALSEARAYIHQILKGRSKPGEEGGPMNKLAQLIRNLPKEDILLIKRDLEEGNLSKVIEERISEFEVPQKVCPICNTPLDDDAPYVLYFGTGVRKKARFDAIDCLEFFIRDLKK